MPSTAAKRFASDLQGIRDRQHISIDDVRDDTKIPRSLIESFEETALLDHPMFNQVYLRSFVRTYAAAIHISPDAVSRAFEEVIDESYDGALAAEYLPAAGEADKKTGSEHPPVEEGQSEEEVAEEEVAEKELAEEVQSKEERAEEEEAEQDQAEEEEPFEEKVAPPKSSAAAAPAWAARSGSSASKKSPTRPDSRGDNSAKWIAGLAAVAVLIAVIWIFYEPGGGGGEESDLAAGQPDTAEQATEDPQAQDFEPIELNETMIFRVTAVSEEGVQDMKVTQDDDVRRPYWIESGQSDTFHVDNRIVFEQQLDEIELQVQGYPYPTDERDDQGRIVVTRQRAQDHLDSLAMARASG